MKPLSQKIEISHKTIVFTILFLLSLYFVFLIKDIIVFVFIAFLVMTAVNPLVSRLESLKLSRGLSAFFVFLFVIGSLIGTLAALVPPLISQSSTLINQIQVPPIITEKFRSLTIDLQDIEVIANQLDSVPKVLNVILSAFSGFLVLISLSVMSFYLTVERRNLHQHLVWLFGNNGAEARAENFVNKIEEQIGGWVRGEFILMFVVGLLTYIGLRLLNINYALPLAILAGALEIVPNIGPIMSAIPAIIIAYLSVSPLLALAVTALYILVQQLENNLIVPMIMKKATGLNPVVTLILLFIGLRLGGFGGAALAIPTFLIVRISIQEFISGRTRKI